MAKKRKQTNLRPKTVAIIQVRMGSTRLYGKPLLPLADKTLLEWIVERVNRSQLVDRFVIATSVEKKDDVLEEFAAQRNIACFRGSERNVLDRYYKAAKAFNAHVIVRLTGDNPLVDGQFIDWVVGEYYKTKADYVAAIPGEEWHLPMGLAAEVFPFDVLHAIWREDSSHDGREHVTPFIRRHPERFHAYYLLAPVDYIADSLSVDTAKDLNLLSKIFSYFGNNTFSWREALDVVAQHPDWTKNRITRE